MSTELLPTRIAVANQKGGVGKTVVSINLGGALANRGLDVLLVDADPQGNATEGLGFADAYESSPPSLHDALVDERYDLVPELVLVEHPEMDLLPANIDMFQTELDLVTAMQGRARLSRVLSTLEDSRAYDVIIMDAPPHLGVLNDAVLLAADELVIPALAESTSERALDILFEQVDTLEDNYGTSVRELAIVANRVENDGEAESTMAWFHATFEPHLPVYEVRKRVALKRAWANGVSTFAAEEDCDMEAVFAEIADHIVTETPLKVLTEKEEKEEQAYA